MLEENLMKKLNLTVVKQITFSLSFSKITKVGIEDIMPTNSILQYFVHQIIQYE